MFVPGRFLRDVKSLIGYPLWVLSRCPPPDNHLRKRKRIIDLCRKYRCETFIETGTFYGQMVNVARLHFRKVLSVELFLPLYELNSVAFASYPNVQILHGDSSERLNEMLSLAEGRVLFWLDGHYSGEGTALGEQTSPIIAELRAIKGHGRVDHCILIDDARLFTGQAGYPTFEEATAVLRDINPHYRIVIDGDCIVALP